MYKLPMDLAAQRQPIAKALTNLESSLERLVDALAHRPVLATIDGAAGERSAIRKACAAYTAIDYAMEDDPNTSPVCLGVIGIQLKDLARAHAVNAAKAALKELCAPLHRIRIRIPVKDQPSPTKAIPAIRVILRNIQRSDLNLLAAYRKIPILGAPPATVTYVRANTRAVYRKTVDEIRELLQALEGPTALADRERLNNLKRGETHLALAKERYQNIRANVLYAQLDPRGRGRIQVAAELPLMYAIGRRAAPPEVTFPSGHDAATDTPRHRQSKLEPTPFLLSLPVYRYLGRNPSTRSNPAGFITRDANLRFFGRF